MNHVRAGVAKSTKIVTGPERGQIGRGVTPAPGHQVVLLTEAGACLAVCPNDRSRARFQVDSALELFVVALEVPNKFASLFVE